MSSRTIRSVFVAAITLGLPAVAIAGSDHPVPTVTAKHHPAPAAASDTSSYAEREASEKSAAEFEGGMLEGRGAGTFVVISGAVLAVLIFAVFII